MDSRRDSAVQRDRSVRRTHTSLVIAYGLVGVLLLTADQAMARTAPQRKQGAITYYARADGGTASQCNGLVDAPYPGKGEGQACAWSSPMIALPAPAYGQTAAPLLHGGDTLLIKSGSYMIGYGAPGASNCNTGATYACTMAPVPSGPSPTQPTRILGADCSAPPQLWGTQRAASVVNLAGSSNVEVGCLEITDHSSCIENHCGMSGTCAGEINRCERDKYPYGTWAENGLTASDSKDVHLHDLNIHGMANEGVRVGRLTDWTMDHVRIYANGFSGWDNDMRNGDKEADTSTHGTIRFSDSEIGYNGCGERYPAGGVYGCWGQNEGGYGDGLGTGPTSGNWIIENVYVHHNTQDGIDLLYADATATVTMKRVRAEGNAGNQLKITGTALIDNANITANCAYFSVPGNVGAGDMQTSDACRASGDAIAAALVDDHVAEVRNSTLTGQGGCLVMGSGGGPKAVLKLTDNSMTGMPRWDDPKRLSCGYDLYQSKAKIVASGNRLQNVKEVSGVRSVCAGHEETCRALNKLYESVREQHGDSTKK